MELRCEAEDQISRINNENDKNYDLFAILRYLDNDEFLELGKALRF